MNDKLPGWAFVETTMMKYGDYPEGWIDRAKAKQWESIGHEISKLVELNRHYVIQFSRFEETEFNRVVYTLKAYIEEL